MVLHWPRSNRSYVRRPRTLLYMHGNPSRRGNPKGSWLITVVADSRYTFHTPESYQRIRWIPRHTAMSTTDTTLFCCCCLQSSLHCLLLLHIYITAFPWLPTCLRDCYLIRFIYSIPFSTRSTMGCSGSKETTTRSAPSSSAGGGGKRL